MQESTPPSDSRAGLSVDADEGNLIKISPNARFERSRIIVKGTNSRIVLGHCLLYKNLFINFIGNNKTLYIGNTVKNIANLRIVSHRGSNQQIRIGSGLSCGGMEIQMNDGSESFELGSNCLLSWGIKARTSDGHSIVDLTSHKAINLPKPIIIGSHVWICEDVKIMKGSRIPSDSVIASGAIVTSSFNDDFANCIFGGIPAKVIKSGITWHREAPEKFNAELEKQ